MSKAEKLLLRDIFISLHRLTENASDDARMRMMQAMNLLDPLVTREENGPLFGKVPMPTKDWEDNVCSQQHPEHENVRCIAAKEHYHNHVGFPELGIMAPSNLYLWHNKGDRPITGSPRLDAEVKEALADRARRVATSAGRDRGQLDPLRNINYNMKWQPHTRQWTALASDGKTLGRGDGATQEEALLDLLSGLMVTIGVLHQRLNDPEETHPDGYPHEEMGG